MINLNPNLTAAQSKFVNELANKNNTKTEAKSDFSDMVKGIKGYMSQVDDLQQMSNNSIHDLLSGKNEDIHSVVSTMAKADMSFKVLVGVRNKLIEAYKQTMNMPI